MRNERRRPISWLVDGLGKDVIVELFPWLVNLLSLTCRASCENHKSITRVIFKRIADGNSIRYTYQEIGAESRTDFLACRMM